MPDLVILGGFLGAGKTTAIVRLARAWIDQGKRVGVIANDQAADLVDTETFRAAGLDAAEVSGGCFCCRFDDLLERADRLIADHRPDVILAEPVGSCTDVVATVIKPLQQRHPALFRIAPYTVLLDPMRALKILGKAERVSLSEKVTYIFKTQQQEADAIAISKIDLLSSGERQRILNLVADHFPGRKVLMFSATTGEGLGELLAWLDSGGALGRLLTELDYDIYAAGEAELGWLNSKLELTGDVAVELDSVLMDLGAAIQERLQAQGLTVAHGKLSLAVGNAVAVLNILDFAGPATLSRSARVTASAMNMRINLRVQADPAALGDIVHECVDDWTIRHHLVITSGKGQAFRPPRPVPTHRVTEDTQSVSAGVSSPHKHGTS